MPNFSKTIILSLIAFALLFSGCKTKPKPVPSQTVTKGINPHPGWVDPQSSASTSGSGSGSGSEGDNVSPYGENGGLGNSTWSDEATTTVIPFEEEAGTLEARDSNTSINDGAELSDVLPPVYFGFDQVAIGEAEREKVDQTAQYLKDNPSYRLRIEGNCDWRGTAQYNLALGDQRASSVKDYLGLLGIASDRVDILSNGDQFAVTDGTDEEMSKDRRADLIVISQ